MNLILFIVISINFGALITNSIQIGAPHHISHFMSRPREFPSNRYRFVDTSHRAELSSNIQLNVKAQAKTKGGGGDWWVDKLPWWMPVPPEWGPLPPTMYTQYYHNVNEFPPGAGADEHKPWKSVENMERPIGENPEEGEAALDTKSDDGDAFISIQETTKKSLHRRLHRNRRVKLKNNV